MAIDLSARFLRVGCCLVGALLLAARGGNAAGPQPSSAARPAQLETRVRGRSDARAAIISTPTSKAAFELVGYGCAGNARALGTSKLVEHSSRTEYRYADVTEWYETDEDGVEQGFTLSNDRCHAKEIELDIRVSGLVPHRAPSGVDLMDQVGNVRMHYTDLSASDARGRSLNATMSVSADHIKLRINTSRAEFPVLVDPEVWSQQGAALAPSDYYTDSLALDGDTALLGSSFSLGQQGAGYVFVRSGKTWAAQGSALVASDGVIPDDLGGRVALSGDSAVLYAGQKSFSDGVYGGIYVFTRSGAKWMQQGAAIEGTSRSKSHGDSFGASVAISGDTIVVGAPGLANGGGAFIFARSGTTWTQQGGFGFDHIFDFFNDGGTVGCGTSVAISGDTILLGCPGSNNGGGAGTGSAIFFIRTGTTWAEQGSLQYGSGVATKIENFGGSVALSGDTALIGAPGGPGAVYIMVRSGTSWSRQGSPLTAANALSSTAFGSSVSVFGDTAGIVGGGIVAYIYRRTGVVWTQVATLNGTPSTVSNTPVSVTADTALVGAGYTALVYSDLCTTTADCPDTAYCASGKCIPRCLHDSDCASGTYCSTAGPCVTQAARGAMCSTAAGDACKEAGCRMCGSGFCTDGVCCESSCAGLCQACSEALTGAADGKCAAIPADQDPGNECPSDSGYPENCGAPGVCDGAGSCRSNAKAGTPCGDTACSAATVTGRVCNGGGLCSNASVSCGDYSCKGNACRTSCGSDTDCAASAYCFSGTCIDKKDNGSACKGPNECAEGFCADGVCCESACGAQCQSCAEKGAEGKCVPVIGTPRGNRNACTGDADLCGGSCDGADVSGCKYAPATKVCDQSCSAGKAKQGTCDGDGHCSDGDATSCGAYNCGAKACLLSCSMNSDCATGYACDGTASQCEPVKVVNSCNSDLSASISSTNGTVACAPYSCEPASGNCHERCTSIDDCASGSICDNNGSCVSASDPSETSAGCSYSMMSKESTGADYVAFSLLLLLGAAVERRRRALG